MLGNYKAFSKLIFLFCAISFFFPFIKFSTRENLIREYSGIALSRLNISDLATDFSMLRCGLSRYDASCAYLRVAFFCGIIGVIVVIIGGRYSGIIQALMGLIGIVSLISFKYQYENMYSNIYIYTKFEPAYYTAVALFVVAIIVAYVNEAESV